jgi:hypothetical protein
VLLADGDEKEDEEVVLDGTAVESVELVLDEAAGETVELVLDDGLVLDDEAALGEELDDRCCRGRCWWRVQQASAGEMQSRFTRAQV